MKNLLFDDKLQIFNLHYLSAGDSISLDHLDFDHDKSSLYCIVWNRDEQNIFLIDGLPVTLDKNEMTFITPNQSFDITKCKGEVLILRFNRDFYCIYQNDHEVSCNGLLFFGSMGNPILILDYLNSSRMEMLLTVIKEEFDMLDHISGEMFRSLLKRWIIISTRVARKQLFETDYPNINIEVFRSFNMLVEENFKKLHLVKQYADLLNKSPKTLANIFKQYNQPSPNKIIQHRIISEAKKYLIYSEKSVKEIAAGLGFESSGTFSRAFKNETSTSPLQFRMENKPPAV
ncbi:helix-turn-helix domain-containing protein [Leptobacterium flavescens]|uniref:Helix-turn-helix domain-containing protein n=1 Tax=Leptobacterium flavescens TaxID=472055 RepID=A0A6P0UPB2_9FLAO|nr:helix-turn-helix transcriptional regulator [Leptobacterium flavescens]NER12753.1 helix-turn-helix domain-containing protein [Leptobacterium flavescens]